MTEYADVQPEIVSQLRSVCLGLPVDWEEVAELVVESYRVLAPRRLVKLVDQATG